jgi:hypothetical protein
MTPEIRPLLQTPGEVERSNTQGGQEWGWPPGSLFGLCPAGRGPERAGECLGPHANRASVPLEH